MKKPKVDGTLLLTIGGLVLAGLGSLLSGKANDRKTEKYLDKKFIEWSKNH